MKSGWLSRRLGDLCTIELGRTPARANGAYWDARHDTNNVWLSIADLSNAVDNVVADSKEYLSDEGAAICKIVHRGTLLVSFKLTLGRLAYAGRDLFTNEAIAALSIRDERELSKDFLFYFLQFFDWVGAAENDVKLKGMTLNKAKLNEIRVVFPDSLPEQQRNVAILDEAFAGIATARANAVKNLRNARAIFESYLNSIFSQRGDGFMETKLSDVCTITSTLVDPRNAEYLDLIHVGAGNIESETGCLIKLQSAREEGLISGKFLFDKSMVLYSKIRPYLMKAARPDFVGLCSADIYPLSPLPHQITRNYLFHMLLSKPFTDYAVQGSARAGMPKVNRDHLFEYRVWLPAVEKQVRLAEKLDRLHDESRRLESTYRRKIDTLDELKKSLLNQAFTGQL